LGNTTSSELNSRGQPLYTADANGNTNYFEYDAHGKQAVAYDSAGVRNETTYTAITNIANGATNIFAAGLTAAETRYAPGVPYPVVTAYTYYAEPSSSLGLTGEVKTVTEKWVDDSGATMAPVLPPTTYDYDANGNRTREIRKATVNGVAGTDVITQYRYDSQNRLFQTIDPLGRTNTVVYNKLGKQAATIDVMGRTTAYLYDVLGNLIETTYPDNAVTRTVFDEKNRVTVTQERAVPDGNGQTTAPATVNTYDKAGRIIRVDRRSGVILARVVWTPGTDFPADPNSISTQQNPAGVETQYAITVTNLGTLESLTRTRYDLAGRVEYSMDARGTVTQSGYDDAGRRTTNRVFTGYTVSPLATGSLVPSSGSAYIETLLGYDPAGNQVWVLDALGHQTDFEFDAANRLVTTRFPQVTVDKVHKTRATEYDGLGRRVRETDEAGVATGFTYDFRGLLTSVTLDAGTTNAVTTSYNYDEAGIQTDQTDALNRVTKFEYDKLGRRTKRILPDNAYEVTAYTDVPETTGSPINVQQMTVTDFRSKTITTTEDRSGRIKSKILPGINPGETSTSVGYVYSDIGLLNRVDMSGQVIRTNYYAYDVLRREVRKDTSEGVLAYAYTPDGALERTKGYRRGAVTINTDPGSATPDVSLGYGYDNLGRLQTVTNNSLATPNVTTYHYDAVGNLDYFVYPNGVKHAYTYTEQNRLTRLTLTRGDNSLLRSFDYTLDPAGHRTGVAETNRVGTAEVERRRVVYEYDHTYGTTPPTPVSRVHRLTREKLFDLNDSAAGTITHVYDGVGNRTLRTSSDFTFTPVDTLDTQSFTFDKRDQIDDDGNDATSSGNYDANGNTIKVDQNHPTGDLYDAENHLISRGTTIQIGYDCDGNRAWKTVSGTTAYYLLDDKSPSGYIQVLAEYSNTANAPDRAYCWGHDLISQSLPSTIFYYGLDGHGSARLLTDSATGSSTTITDTYDYDAYGMLLIQAHSGASETPNQYRYGGQQWDGDVGMYFQRARYYQPGIGRFWTMDTWDGQNNEPLSLHKYLYGSCDPVNRLDPSGHGNILFARTGKRVEKEIQRDFEFWSIDPKMDRTVNEVLNLPVNFPVFGALKPDLVERGSSPCQVYEIKAVGDFLEGRVKLQLYLWTLKALDPQRRQWVAGYSYRPPSIVDACPLAIAIVSPPLDGVILYQVIDMPSVIAAVAVLVRTQFEVELATIELRTVTLGF